MFFLYKLTSLKIKKIIKIYSTMTRCGHRYWAFYLLGIVSGHPYEYFMSLGPKVGPTITLENTNEEEKLKQTRFSTVFSKRLNLKPSFLSNISSFSSLSATKGKKALNNFSISCEKKNKWTEKIWKHVSRSERCPC